MQLLVADITLFALINLAIVMSVCERDVHFFRQTEYLDAILMNYLSMEGSRLK